MNTKICDVCLSEGKTTVAKWIGVFKRGPEKMGVHICEGHRGFTKEKSYDEARDVLLQAQMKHGEILYGIYSMSQLEVPAPTRK